MSNSEWTVNPASVVVAAIEIHDHLMTDERFAPPVLADEGEQTVLDLVPLAGSRRQVADGNPQASFVG